MKTGTTKQISPTQITTAQTTTTQTTTTQITYFTEGGAHNSRTTYELARKRAEELGIREVIIASIRGGSVESALDVFEGSDVLLTFASCNACDGCPRFDENLRVKLEQAGHRFMYANEEAYPFPPAAQLAYRRICEGMKVCVHLAMAVVEEGLVPPGEEIIAIAGTGWKGYAKGGGSDTAVVIEAQSAETFFSYASLPEHKLHGRKIKEIICMPR